VLYILAWNNDNSIKDLTPRYAPQWMTVTRKHRIDAIWWEKTLLPWKPKLSAIEKEENRDLDCILAEKPLPASIAE
jgi:xeroderma pigmentosum group C-complementing protein